MSEFFHECALKLRVTACEFNHDRSEFGLGNRRNGRAKGGV